MTPLQHEQPTFDRAICDAMVASTPDDWSLIVLTLERSEGATAIGEFSHSLSVPEHNRSATPDDSLYEATYWLDEMFQRHAAMFRRAIYRVELLPNSWKYTADFAYDETPKSKARRK